MRTKFLGAFYVYICEALTNHLQVKQKQGWTTGSLEMGCNLDLQRQVGVKKSVPTQEETSKTSPGVLLITRYIERPWRSSFRHHHGIFSDEAYKRLGIVESKQSSSELSIHTLNGSGHWDQDCNAWPESSTYVQLWMQPTWLENTRLQILAVTLSPTSNYKDTGTPRALLTSAPNRMAGCAIVVACSIVWYRKTCWRWARVGTW